MEFLAGLHPLVVHFPIALLLVYALLETVGALLKNNTFSNAAFILLIVGFVAAIAAMITGEQAQHLAENWNKSGLNNSATIPYNLIDEHKNWASVTIWYFLFILIIRTLFVINFVVKKKFGRYYNTARYIFAVLSIIGCFFIYETGGHGGELVYKYGVGTELIKPSTPVQKKNRIEIEKLE
ncbi:MAG TPA: hypothetical protein PK397_05385 [Ignavibacteriaceae bacterium]|nr:hypothetical protein [Ignavibacteriaceae bacterium]